MALRNAFADLATEDTTQTLLYLLTAILEKMPRVDNADRLVITSVEAGSQAVTVSSGTVTTVTTVTTVGNQTNLGGRDATNIPQAVANMGTAHIYNNIIVS